MPVSGFGGICYEGAYEKTPNFERKIVEIEMEFWYYWICGKQECFSEVYMGNLE
jgi:hypothetical protein